MVLDLGAVCSTTLKQAWQALINRHDVLRTAFVHTGLDKPLHLVSAHVEMPWREESIGANQNEVFESILRSEKTAAA